MDLSNLLSGALGAFAVSVIDALFWRRQSALERRINTLESEKVDKLGDRFERHIESDASPRIMATLREMEKRADEREARANGQFSKLFAKVDRSLEANERQAAQLENQKEAISELRSDLARHRERCREDNHA